MHRLGRTGRAGQAGCGLLVLLPFERLSRWNQSLDQTNQFAFVNEPSVDVETKIQAVHNHVRGGHSILFPNAEAAYRSFVAHYLEYGGDKLPATNVLEAAKQLATSFGLSSLPSLPEDVLSKIKK